MITAIAVVAWVGFAAWTIQLGYRKNQLLPAIVLGCCFAWFGLIVVALLPNRRRLTA